MAPPVPDGFATTYAALVERRRTREPLQHLVGSTGFRYLTLLVEPGVFVPRPETEVVAQAAIDEAVQQSSPLVVDLCCGAGGIAIAVATEVPQASVRAVDLSPEAVALTRRNAEANGAANLEVEVGDVADGTLLRELDGSVDVLVANPPYIPPDAEPVDPEVRDHDPDLALYGGGPDGLEVPRAVLRTAARLLRPGGLLVMEHAEVQDAAVRADARATGAFEQIESRDDLTGRPRMLVARRSSHPLVTDSAP
jgi:release factor glutamine methyltransferase